MTDSLLRLTAAPPDRLDRELHTMSTVIAGWRRNNDAWSLAWCRPMQAGRATLGLAPRHVASHGEWLTFDAAVELEHILRLGRSYPDTTLAVDWVDDVTVVTSHEVDGSAETEPKSESRVTVVPDPAADTLSEFACAVSHDVAEPLQAIHGYIDLLAERLAAIGATDEAIDHYLSRIDEAAATAGEIVASFATMSHVERHPEPGEIVDLDAVFAEVERELAESIRRIGARFEVDALPQVYGDRGPLISAFRNLVSNALKFRDPDRLLHIRVTATEHEGWVVVLVRDNGRGISREFRERAFDMFTQFDPEDEGAGIGLALVRSVIERHGGDVVAVPNGRGGPGTTFRCSLPAVRTPTGQRRSDPADGARSVIDLVARAADKAHRHGH